MDYYRALGKGVPMDEILFEKSPTYYKSLSVPGRVKKMDPNTKIVRFNLVGENLWFFEKFFSLKKFLATFYLRCKN